MQPHAYNLQKRLQSLLTPHNLQLKLWTKPTVKINYFSINTTPTRG